MPRKKKTTEQEDPKSEAPQEEETIEESKVVSEPEPRPGPKEEPKGFVNGNTVVEVRPAGGKAAVMKRKLEAQPRVAIMVPLAEGEPFGATESVILNGYRLNVKKGVYVQVPQQVAEILMESQRMTREAIENHVYRLDNAGMSQAMRERGETRSAL